MRRLAVLTVLAASTVALVAAPAHAATVSVPKYVNGVCISLITYRDDTEALGTAFQESVEGSQSLDHVKSQLLGFLDDMVASTQQLGTDLRQAGTPKLENGAKISKALRSGIAQMEDVIAQTRVDAEGLATTSPATFQSETRALLDDMSDEINDIGDGFDAVDKRFDTSSLENAQEKDPDCNGLD